MYRRGLLISLLAALAVFAAVLLGAQWIFQGPPVIPSLTFTELRREPSGVVAIFRLKNGGRSDWTYFADKGGTIPAYRRSYSSFPPATAMSVQPLPPGKSVDVIVPVGSGADRYVGVFVRCEIPARIPEQAYHVVYPPSLETYVRKTIPSGGHVAEPSDSIWISSLPAAK